MFMFTVLNRHSFLPNISVTNLLNITILTKDHLFPLSYMTIWQKVIVLNYIKEQYLAFPDNAS